MHVSRRGFFKICAAGMTGSSLATMGFAPSAALASVRHYKLAHATETRSICPYCSVSCGTLVYSMGDLSKNSKPRIFHIEGDPDNPVNRGSLCPKGAGLLDMVQSPLRLHYPEVREPGTNAWKRISWDDAFNRIARHMKDDRDANFVEQNANGLTVNRWTTTGYLASSAASNEPSYLSIKVMRSLGVVAIDTQARI